MEKKEERREKLTEFDSLSSCLRSSSWYRVSFLFPINTPEPSALALATLALSSSSRELRETREPRVRTDAAAVRRERRAGNAAGSSELEKKKERKVQSNERESIGVCIKGNIEK